MEELFEQIIYQAIKKNVSDIHLQCTEKGVIKFRICGELLTYETYEKTNIIQLMNYIRFISKIDFYLKLNIHSIKFFLVVPVRSRSNNS